MERVKKLLEDNGYTVIANSILLDEAHLIIERDIKNELYR